MYVYVYIYIYIYIHITKQTNSKQNGCSRVRRALDVQEEDVDMMFIMEGFTDNEPAEVSLRVFVLVLLLLLVVVVLFVLQCFLPFCFDISESPKCSRHEPPPCELFAAHPPPQTHPIPEAPRRRQGNNDNDNYSNIYIYIHIYCYLSLSLSLCIYIYICISLSLSIYIYIYIYTSEQEPRPQAGDPKGDVETPVLPEYKVPRAPYIYIYTYMCIHIYIYI